MKKRAGKTPKQRKKRVNYEWAKCPGYCCSVYELVVVTKRDVARIARHFQVPEDEAVRKFTKIHSSDRVLRRKADHVLGDACRFLDLEHRRCTIYEARPEVCRGFPHDSRCTFYDLLQFHREYDEEDTLPLVTISRWKRS